MKRLPNSNQGTHANRPRCGSFRSGITLIEVMICVTIAGLVLSIAATNLVESAELGLKASQTLEHSRSARELFDRLTIDIRHAQVMSLYSSFEDRSRKRRDGEAGNYLVLQTVDDHGNITRTVGYYIEPASDGSGGVLFRHDSERGDSTAELPPGIATAGDHQVVTRSVQLPGSSSLFTCVRDRGVSVHGEFGGVDGSARGRPDFIRCVISTRS
jgi:prepilin-type N-terminal cleavage/methylation domain-containing protein